ncbi:hypothetical protein C8Q73DRAFT_694657 [Cubamyces lactineus]|nr:hypothetical protein C8Q73DRAFT_694657 [Cubamyces lactineus]
MTTSPISTQSAKPFGSNASSGSSSSETFKTPISGTSLPPVTTDAMTSSSHTTQMQATQTTTDPAYSVNGTASPPEQSQSVAVISTGTTPSTYSDSSTSAEHTRTNSPAATSASVSPHQSAGEGPKRLGGIVGGVVGGAVLCVFAIFLALWSRRHRRCGIAKDQLPATMQEIPRRPSEEFEYEGLVPDIRESSNSLQYSVVPPAEALPSSLRLYVRVYHAPRATPQLNKNRLQDPNDPSTYPPPLSVIHGG